MGTTFSFSKNITSFQVFCDYSGTSLNAHGNACDQVFLYGRITAGAISDNNEVRVYGRRDRRNNVVIAKTVLNIACGTIIKASNTISSGTVRIITLLLVGLLTLLIHSAMTAVGSAMASASEQGGVGLALIIILAVLWLFFRNR
jgi:hypothetical protein